MIIFVVYNCRMTTKKITIVAQKSFIIKKKIILEDPISNNGAMTESLDSKACFDIFSPLIKIDCQRVLIDADESKSGTTQYEIPLDKQWEMDREKLALFLFFLLSILLVLAIF